MNCGGCGLECRNPNGTTSCTSGTCVPMCTAGSEDCNNNKDDGCEVFRDRNPTCGQMVNMGAVPGDVQPSSIEYVGSDESHASRWSPRSRARRSTGLR